MSDVQALLTRCRELGAELIPTPHGTLKVKAPAPLPKELQTELKERKAEVLALLPRLPDNRADYHKAAVALADDCYAIDPCWLIERHPTLWFRMKALDGTLVEMERQGAPGAAYRAKLEELIACVREARTRQEHTPPLPQ